MKKTFTLSVLMLILSVLFASPALAYDVEVNGIYYNLYTSKEAEVSRDINNKYSGHIEIPSTITVNEVVYTVTSIGYAAFGNCSGLTSVSIPNSVKSIGKYAFCDCVGLPTITIPNSVTEIRECAFKNCSGFTTITIPNSVKSIEDGVFEDCVGLMSITIPNSITSISYSAFVIVYLEPYN